MDKSRMSLMTFPMGQDLWRWTMSIEDTLMVAKRNGVPYVDLMDVRRGKIKKYFSAMTKTGIQVYTYMINTSFLQKESKWTKDVANGIETATALGAKYLMIIPYNFQDRAKAIQLGHEGVMHYMIDGFRKAITMAKDSDLTVCFETTPHDLSCLSGTEDCLEILNAVQDLGFIFDTANMLPHGDDPVESYEKLKEYISYVHLKDVVLKDSSGQGYEEIAANGKKMQAALWGTGVIPVQEIYEKMLTDGYTGNFAIEYVRPEGSACRLEKHVEQLSHFLQSFLC